MNNEENKNNINKLPNQDYSSRRLFNNNIRNNNIMNNLNRNINRIQYNNSIPSLNEDNIDDNEEKTNENNINEEVKNTEETIKNVENQEKKEKVKAENAVKKKIKKKLTIKIAIGAVIIFFPLIIFIVLFSLIGAMVGMPSSEYDGSNTTSVNENKINSGLKIVLDNKEVSIEDYVSIALAAQVTESDTLETLKAKAILIRTMVTDKTEYGTKSVTSDDLFPTSNSTSNSLVTQAVSETSGQILESNGNVLDTSSINYLDEINKLSTDNTLTAQQIISNNYSNCVVSSLYKSNDKNDKLSTTGSELLSEEEITKLAFSDISDPDSLPEWRKNILLNAASAVGRKYLYGGNPTAPGLDGIPATGIDCRGFVEWVYWTTFGFKAVPTTHLGTKGMITAYVVNKENPDIEVISIDEVLPGDIALTNGHTTIVASDRKSNGFNYLEAMNKERGIVKTKNPRIIGNGRKQETYYLRYNKK